MVETANKTTFVNTEINDLRKLNKLFAFEECTAEEHIVRSTQYTFIPLQKQLALGHITRKGVSGDFRPGKIQTSLFSYRN